MFRWVLTTGKNAISHSLLRYDLITHEQSLQHMQKMAWENPLSDIISGCQVLDAGLMSFDPSANHFNSLHYLGWMGDIY